MIVGEEVVAGEALVGGGAWRVEGGGTTNAGEDTGTVWRTGLRR